MADSSTYDTDILAWSEQQAALLRGLSTARVRLPNDLDIDHIAEEIEAVGRSELASVRSLIAQILTHLVKLLSDPEAPPLQHWRAEALAFHHGLVRRFTPSMRAKIDMDAEWRNALQQAMADLNLHAVRVAPGLPEACPITLDDMLDEAFDLAVLATRVARR